MSERVSLDPKLCGRIVDFAGLMLIVLTLLKYHLVIQGRQTHSSLLKHLRSRKSDMRLCVVVYSGIHMLFTK